MFGEVETEFSIRDNITLDRFGDRSINTRRVKWVQHLKERRVLPRDIAEHLSKPPSVHEFSRSAKNDRVFGYIYDTYVTEQTSEVTIRAPEYTGNSPQDIIKYFKLVNLSAALVYASELGVEADQFHRLSLDQIISTYLPEDEFEQYMFSFASPGFTKIKPRQRLAALAISAMIPLMCAGLTGCSPETSIYVTNSSGEIDDEAKRDVERALSFSQNTMSADQKKQADALASDVSSAMAVTSGAEIEE